MKVKKIAEGVRGERYIKKMSWKWRRRERENYKM